MKATALRTVPVRFKGDVSIKDEALPKEVREYFYECRMDRLAVVRMKNDLWLACWFEAKHIDLNEYDEFEVHFTRRAKGPGWIAIEAYPKQKGQACATILEYEECSEGMLQGAKDVAKELEDVLGYQLRECDFGPDY